MASPDTFRVSACAKVGIGSSGARASDALARTAPLNCRLPPAGRRRCSAGPTTGRGGPDRTTRLTKSGPVHGPSKTQVHGPDRTREPASQAPVTTVIAGCRSKPIATANGSRSRPRQSSSRGPGRQGRRRSGWYPADAPRRACRASFRAPRVAPQSSLPLPWRQSPPLDILPTAGPRQDATPRRSPPTVGDPVAAPACRLPARRHSDGAALSQARPDRAPVRAWRGGPGRGFPTPR